MVISGSGAAIALTSQMRKARKNYGPVLLMKKKETGTLSVTSGWVLKTKRLPKLLSLELTGSLRFNTRKTAKHWRNTMPVSKIKINSKALDSRLSMVKTLAFWKTGPTTAMVFWASIAEPIPLSSSRRSLPVPQLRSYQKSTPKMLKIVASLTFSKTRTANGKSYPKKHLKANMWRIFPPLCTQRGTRLRPEPTAESKLQWRSTFKTSPLYTRSPPNPNTFTRRPLATRWSWSIPTPKRLFIVQRAIWSTMVKRLSTAKISLSSWAKRRRLRVVTPGTWAQWWCMLAKFLSTSSSYLWLTTSNFSNSRLLMKISTPRTCYVSRWHKHTWMRTRSTNSLWKTLRLKLDLTASWIGNLKKILSFLSPSIVTPRTL